MRIMLDECITRGPAQTLISFFGIAKPPVEAAFVVDYFSKQGIKDEHWSDVLKQEGGWCVITHDLDKSKKKKDKRLADGPPLPSILPTKGITAVYLTGKLGNATGTEKVIAVVSVWEEMRKFFETSPPGSRMRLTRPGKRYELKDF